MEFIGTIIAQDHAGGLDMLGWGMAPLYAWAAVFIYGLVKS